MLSKIKWVIHLPFYTKKSKWANVKIIILMIKSPQLTEKMKTLALLFFHEST